MTKRHQQKKGHQPQPDNDKPQYAADYPVAKAKEKQKKSGQKSDNPHLEEHLQSDVVGKLNRLKARLDAEEQGDTTKNTGNRKQQSPGPSHGVHRSNVGGKRYTKQDSATDRERRDKSFAELFDPVEEDEDSFEDLLKSSKLDWRKFK